MNKSYIGMIACVRGYYTIITDQDGLRIFYNDNYENKELGRNANHTDRFALYYIIDLNNYPFPEQRESLKAMLLSDDIDAQKYAYELISQYKECLI